MDGATDQALVHSGLIIKISNSVRVAHVIFFQETDGKFLAIGLCNEKIP